ncbi:MAG: hypothetical protein VB876_15465 [Pirellulales bacterium]
MQTGWKFTALPLCGVSMLVGLWGCSCSDDSPPPRGNNRAVDIDWEARTADQQAVKDFSDSKKGTTIILDRKEEGEAASGELRIPELRSDKHFLEFVNTAPPSTFRVAEFRSTSPELTDASMLSLPKFTNVTFLFLEGTGITSQGLVHVKPLKNIEEITLANTSITNSALEHLAQLPNLRSLTLSGCKGITDAGMIHLTSLQQLRELALAETGVGDTGLFDLGQLKQLQVLNVERTKVTNEGVKNLKGMLPSTRIYSDFFVPSIDPGTPPHLRGQ